MTEQIDHDEQRRARRVQQLRETTGVDEEMIARLVHTFYARVREDGLLGPIFAARVADWDAHLARMCDFWSSLIFSSGVYRGQPMRAHLPLPVDARHFDRWLALFEETARELFEPAVANLFLERARRIAQSLELGVASAHGVLLGKGERFVRPELATA